MSRQPKGILIIGALLLAGAGIATVTGMSLVRPGTFLDRLWSLNPAALRDFKSLGRVAGPMLLALAVVATFAGAGLLKRRRWGWRLTLGLLAVNCVGDTVRFFFGEYVKSAAGMIIAGGFLIYLIRPEIRKYYERTL